MNRRERKHCPHVDVIGVWGDAINHAPGYRRNYCRDCGRHLDGPVTISTDRQELRQMRRERDSEQ